MKTFELDGNLYHYEFAMFPNENCPDILDLNQLVEVVSRLSERMIFHFVEPEYVYMGAHVAEPKRMVPSSLGGQTGFTATKIVGPAGRQSIAHIKDHPGLLLVTDCGNFPGHLFPKPIIPRPIWDNSYEWINDEGKVLAVKLAKNSHLLAFRRPDNGEWELSSLQEMVSWGFKSKIPLF